jgi:hypothetical protein
MNKNESFFNEWMKGMWVSFLLIFQSIKIFLISIFVPPFYVLFQRFSLVFKDYFVLEKMENLENYHIPRENLEMKYHAKDFEGLQNIDLVCRNCEKDYPLKEGQRTITEMYGNLGVEIETNASCPYCLASYAGKVRFTKGYMLSKEDNGDWVVFIPQEPFLKKLWRYFFK